LINLLPRFFDPTSGQILINGVDLKNLDLEKSRADIGYVTQMTMLFGDSIYSNISYGCEEASLLEVEHAAKKAHAHDFIVELEDGYESEISEHGSNLSGGQRQRLSLARAILKDPKILILDEATSQIDPESEKLIHDALRDFICDRTTIIVTHRMSTLDLVDYILVMSDGLVVDFGTHEQLLSRCPTYQRLRSIELEEAA
ncbi:MAG: ATP-binding cassette domain-containing protein, partial [Planctomycetota bacterium]